MNFKGFLAETGLPEDYDAIPGPEEDFAGQREYRRKLRQELKNAKNTRTYKTDKFKEKEKESHLKDEDIPF